MLYQRLGVHFTADSRLHTDWILSPPPPLTTSYLGSKFDCNVLKRAGIMEREMRFRKTMLIFIMGAAPPCYCSPHVQTNIWPIRKSGESACQKIWLNTNAISPVWLAPTTAMLNVFPSLFDNWLAGCIGLPTDAFFAFDFVIGTKRIQQFSSQANELN